MNIFTKKNDRYAEMISDISREIDSYTKKSKQSPRYIIIHTEDLKFIVAEMVKHKLMPETAKVDKLSLLGIRVIRTTDIREGAFDAVG